MSASLNHQCLHLIRRHLGAEPGGSCILKLLTPPLPAAAAAGSIGRRWRLCQPLPALQGRALLLLLLLLSHLGRLLKLQVVSASLPGRSGQRLPDELGGCCLQLASGFTGKGVPLLKEAVEHSFFAYRWTERIAWSQQFLGLAFRAVGPTSKAAKIRAGGEERVPVCKRAVRG